MKTKLNTKNIPEYLVNIGISTKVVSVLEITKHTNVNFVFQVKFVDQTVYYLKQAFNYVKIAPDFKAPIDRQYYEYKALIFLKSYWKCRIPEIIFYDRNNDILVLTDIGKDSKLLAEEFEWGHLHLNIAKDLGHLMGKLHGATYDRGDFPIRDINANKRQIKEIVKDFRLKGAFELMPKETGILFKKSNESKKSIIYADWATKNILVKGTKVKIVDFENVVSFDPAFDIGYALAHWFLELEDIKFETISIFVSQFEKEYRSVFKSSDVNKIMSRATKYIGALMLHRLVGIKNTNRLDIYLNKEVDMIGLAKKILILDCFPSVIFEKIQIHNF